MEVALVFFDQILDNLGYTDNWKDTQVRDALAPIRTFARATDCAVLMTLHPNKRGGSFRNRVSGTPAFNALSRSSLLVALHPDDNSRVVVVRPKGNYAAEPPAVEFRIAATTVTPPGQSPLMTAQVKDVRQSHLRAADILDVAPSRQQADSKVGRCRTLLGQLLADGEWHAIATIIKELEGQGFTDRTVRLAGQHLKVVKHREGFGKDGVWSWRQEK